jgi:hypothetical protein
VTGFFATTSTARSKHAHASDFNSATGFFAMNDPSAPKPTLPPGESDPNQLYNAVGRAIDAWENMEEALARLYAKIAGLPEQPNALSYYGAENRKFIERYEALKSAAEAYFVRCPDQEREGTMYRLLEDARDLSIKRHRIAHGHVTQWGELHFPENLERGQRFDLTATFLYRWGAPWYSMTTLRTDPIGGDAASIEASQKEFEALNIRIHKFTAELPKKP